MSQSLENRGSKSWLWGAAGLLAMVLIAYIPVIRTGGFIWDDPQHITENPLLHTAWGLLDIWIHPLLLPQYYPLVHTTFWIEYHLVGLNPRLYHIDNILLHCLGAILLWRALHRLGVPAAGLAAAIFAIHPVQVESVAWITERKNVLSLVFYLLSLHAYLDFAGEDLRTPKFRRKPYFISLTCFIAALLSKSVACSLPAAILLLVYWKHGQIRWRDLRPLVPFFILGLIMSLVTSWLESAHVGASGPDWNITLIDRFLIAGRALWFYLAKLLWPHPLIFSYPRWVNMNLRDRPWLIAFPLSAAGAIAALWLLRRRIGRGPLVAILFFAGTLLPALGFINLFPMRYSFVADHFQYVACIGPIILAAAGIQRLCGRRTPLIAADILAALGLLVWIQGPIYHSEVTIWENTTKLNPSSWMAWGDLGDQYADLSNGPNLTDAERLWYRSKAKQCYAMLYKIAPDRAMSHYKWGVLQQYEGNLNAARDEFAKALSLEPDFTVVMNCMGQVLMLQHQPQEAMNYFRRAIELDGGYIEVRLNYGDALLATGDVQGAMDQYSQAVAHRPDNVPSQFRLGNLLLNQQHRPDLAAPHYIAALHMDPNRADILTNLAVALREMGWTDAAREQCRKALEIQPNLPQAQQLWKALSSN